MKNKKIIWINPISHYVYQGWLHFFDKYFDLEMYDEAYQAISYGKHFDLKKYKKNGKTWKGNFYNFYKNPINKKENKNNIKIIGDIFTNSLCFSFLFDKNNIFYSEYFEIGNETKKKKILSYIFTLPFRNKKFILPIKKSINFFEKITNKIFYLPQLYVGNLNKDIKILKNKEKINILYVGNLSDWKKNVEVLFKIIDKIGKDGFILNLVGQENRDLFKKYDYLFKKGFIKYYGFVNHNELEKIYKNNDIFLFPSYRDPIGAVTLEAMANGLAIITNKNVGSSSYVTEGKNGFIIDNPSDIEKYIEILYIFKKDINLLNKFKKESVNIVYDSHYIGNINFTNKLYQDFLNFINN